MSDTPKPKPPVKKTGGFVPSVDEIAAALQNSGDNSGMRTLKADSTKYDSGFLITGNDPLGDLQEQRAQRQSGWEQIGHGVAKGALLAGTTVADTFVGLPVGILSAAGAGISGKSFDESFSKVYDNPITQALEELNKSAEEVLPNYYTKKEQSADALSTDNWATANFLGDKLLKNAGFTAGAILGGGVIAKGANALGKLAMGGRLAAELAEVSKLAEGGMKLSDAFNKVAKGKKLVDAASRYSAAAIAAAGEGSAEALQAKEATKEALTKMLTEKASKEGRLPTEQELVEVEKMSSAAGNTTFAMNLPLLMASDLIQFGKVLGGGFNKEVRALSQGRYTPILKDGVYEGAKASMKSKAATVAGKLLLDPLTESLEEGSQTAIQAGALSFQKRKYDKEQTDYFNNLIKSTSDGLTETFQTKEGIEGMLLGFLTGSISHVATGGIADDLRDTKAKETNSQVAADFLNSYHEKSGTKDLLQAAIRNRSLSADMEKAISEGDKFQYKNLENDFFKSVVQNSISRGTYDLLLDKLDEQKKISPEEFKDIYGVDADMESVDQYISSIERQIKSLKAVNDQVEARFPHAPAEVKEAFFDGIANIRNLEERELQLNGEAKQPAGKYAPHVLGVDLLTLKKAATLAGNDYEQALQEATKDMSPDVQNTIWDAASEIERIHSRKQTFGELYKQLLTPEGQAAVVAETQAAKVAATQPTPAPVAPAPTSTAPAPVAPVAPASVAPTPTQPAVPAQPAVPSPPTPGLITDIAKLPEMDAGPNKGKNKMVKIAAPGAVVGAELDSSGKVVRFFMRAQREIDMPFDENYAAYGKALEDRFAASVQSAPAPVVQPTAPVAPITAPPQAPITPPAPTTLASTESAAVQALRASLIPLRAAGYAGNAPDIIEAALADNASASDRSNATQLFGNMQNTTAPELKEAMDNLFAVMQEWNAAPAITPPPAPTAPAVVDTPKADWKPQDYAYLETGADGFSGKDLDDQPLRDAWMEDAKAGKVSPLTVVKENGYQRNVYATLNGKTFKLGYLKTTTGKRKLDLSTVTPELAAAYGHIKGVEAVIDEKASRQPVPLLFQMRSTLDTKAQNKTTKPLSELDERFMFEGDYVILQQLRPTKPGKETKNVLGKYTLEDLAEIEKLNADGKNKLTDGYIIKVSQPTGNSGVSKPRYIAAKTLSASADNFTAVATALASNGTDKQKAEAIDKAIFVASKKPGTHIQAVGDNFEVVANDENNTKLGYLRFKKDATFTDEASFIDALEFKPVGTEQKREPASDYISSVRQQILPTDTRAEVLSKLLPATSEQLYDSISIVPMGVAEEVVAPAKLSSPLPMVATNTDAVGDKPAKKQEFDDASALDEELADDDIALKVRAEEVLQSTDYKQAAKNISRILGARFTVKDLNELVARNTANGNTMAAYLDKIVYLDKFTEKGVEYHEAFHAVFRALLSPSERQKYYNLQKRKSDLSDKRVKAFKKHPHYSKLSDAKARKLLLEEDMADGFQAYMASKPTGFLNKLFAFLKDMVKLFSGNRDEIERLFSKIDAGGFKHTPISDNGKEIAYKTVPFFSVEQSQKVVRLLAVRFAKARATSTKTDEELLKQVILERAMEDSVEENYTPEQRKELGLIGLSEADALARGLTSPGVYRMGYLHAQAQAVLGQQIMKHNAYLNFIIGAEADPVESEDESSDDADADDVNSVKEKIGSGGILEVNSVKNVSQEIRQIISYTTYGEGKNEQAVDFGQTVSILERILENVRSFEEMEKKVVARIQDGENQQLKAVWEALAGTENSPGYFTGKDGDLYRRKFQQGFYRILVSPMQLRVGLKDNTTDMFAANRKSIALERVGQFRSQWNTKKAFHESSVAAFPEISKQLDFHAQNNDVEQMLALVPQLVKVMDGLGVDLSKTFLSSIMRGTNENYKLRKQKDEDGKEWKGLLNQLGSIVSQQSTGRNPFDGERVNGNKEGATVFAGQLAEEDALWRDTLINPSYKNAEGKSQYAYTQPSFVLEKTRDVMDNKVDTSSAYFSYNPLVQLNKKDGGQTFQGLQMGVFSGIRVTDQAEGQTFGNLDVKTYFLAAHTAYQNNYSIPFQFETKSTTLVVRMPEWGVGHFFKDNAITDAALSNLRDMVRAEQLYVENTWKRLDAMSDAQLKEEGIKNRDFVSWKGEQPVRVTREQVEAAKKSGNFKGIPRGLYISKFPGLSTKADAELTDEFLDSYFKKFTDEMIAAHSKQLTAAGLDVKDEKVRKMLMGKSKSPDWNNHLGEMLLKDFIFTDSYSQLVRGHESYFKDGVDITKRAAGLLAAGPALGEKSFNMAMLQTDAFHIYTDSMQPVSEEDQELLNSGKASDELKERVAQVDATDAQGFITGKRFKYIMQQQARISVAGLEAIDKVIAGEPITSEEGKTFVANSLKNIYYGEEPDGGQTYIKTSVVTLFKEFTSFKNKKGDWVAKPGMEKWHNLREKMEAIDGETGAEAYHETAVKLGQRAMNFRKEDGSHGDLMHRPLQNSNWRLQVENPSGKDKITDGTQLLQILDSGMKDSDTFVRDEKEYKVGQLRDDYQRLLSQLRIGAATKFVDLQSKLVEGVSLYKQGLVDNLEASNSDQNTLDFFKVNNGEFVLSTDLPSIQQKFQEMVLSSWNKNVFSHKVPGRKLSLVTSAMAEVVVDANGDYAHDWSKPFSEQAYINEDGSLKEGYTSRRLAMHTLENNEIKHAEVILSEEILFQRGITLADLYGEKTSQATRDKILEELGFRIPSQDKHSTMPYKVVGWVPAYMGSIVIAPAQITYLSGADYDIDSLYVVRREFYKAADGSIKFYGQAKDAEQMLEEYNLYHKKNTPKALQVKYSVEEFSKSPKTTPYAVQNKLMDVRMNLAMNPHDWEAAKSPAAMDTTAKLAKLLPKYSGRSSGFKLPYNTLVNRANDRNNNMAGAANIGPNAKGNITGAFLSKHNYELNVPIQFGSVRLTGYSGAMDKDFILEEVDGKLTVKSETTVGADGKMVTKSIVGAKRKQDTSSDMISTATDNAKDPKAATINYTLDNLAVAQNLIHLGAGLERITTFLNQPILWQLSERQQQAKSLVSSFEASGDVLRNMVREYTKALDAYKSEASNGMLDENLVANISGKLPNVVEARDSSGRAVRPAKLTSQEQVDFVAQQLDVLLQYQRIENFTTGHFAQVGRLLALTKGVGSDFSSLDKFQNAVEALTNISVDGRPRKEHKTKKDAFGRPLPEIRLDDDLNNILEKEHMLRTNIENLQKLVKSMPYEFILRRQPTRDLQKRYKTMGLKNDQVQQWQSEYLAFLAVNSWQHTSKNGQLTDYQYLLTDRENNIVKQRDNLLAKYPELKTNPFIQNTQNVPATKNNPINRLTFNTRTSMDRAVLESITDGYLALFSSTNPEISSYAKNIFFYEGVLNNWQFKNDSVIKLLPASLHKGESEGLKQILASGSPDYASVGMAPLEAEHRFGQHFWSNKKNRFMLSEYGREHDKLRRASMLKTVEEHHSWDFSNVESEEQQTELRKMGYFYSEETGWNFPEFYKVILDEETYKDRMESWEQGNRDAEANNYAPSTEKPEDFDIYEMVKGNAFQGRAIYAKLAVNPLAEKQSVYHLPIEEARKRMVATSRPTEVSAPAASAPTTVNISSSTKKSPFFEKDAAKFAPATKLISRGSAASSSAAYAVAAGSLSNSGVYSPIDIVAISAEGKRGGRIAPDFTEIQKAINAKVRGFITDVKADRQREYNLGEREVEAYLSANGYQEVKDSGRWIPASKTEAHLSALEQAALEGANLTPDQTIRFNNWNTLHPNMAHFTPTERINAIKSEDEGTSNIKC